jgi:hypothetical protein
VLTRELPAGEPPASGHDGFESSERSGEAPSPQASDRTDVAVDARSTRSGRHTRIPRWWGAIGAADRRLILRSTLGGALASLVAFVTLLWDFRFDPFRTAGAHRFASNFYDLQGRSLLDGRLSLPTGSIGIEGFVIDGRTYMYFPPFPAILRIPVLLVTKELDGRLTAPSMLLAWFVLVAATSFLLWNIRLLLRPSAPVTRLEAGLYGVVLASATGGSSTLFLASLPWVYHEVYMWGAAFTVATLACLVALTRRPNEKLVLATGACALGAILTRTTSGWAMCVTILATAGVHAIRGRDPSSRRRLAARLAAAGLVPLLIGVVVNRAKFRHPYMFPLEHQEWTRISSRRRLALRMNGGDITGPQFFVTSLVNYFRPDGVRLVSNFPFVTLPAEPAPSYGGAFLDQWYRTGSVPAFMPLLFGLTIWGYVAAVRVRVRASIRALWIPLLGSLSMCGGVMLYGYVAHRYISEFLPALTIGACVGIVDLVDRLGQRSSRTKRLGVSCIVLLAAFGAWASTAAGVQASRQTWRGERLEQYVTLQYEIGRRIGQIDELVAQSPTLPADGPADQLHVVGDCDALYLATGDAYEPWVTVQVRDIEVDVMAGDSGFGDGVVPLVEFDGVHTRHISLESDAGGRVRLRLGEGFVYYPTEWIDVEPGDRLDLRVRVDTERDRFNITFGGTDLGYFSAAEADGDRAMVIVQPRLARQTRAVPEQLGFEITARRGQRLELCDDLIGASADRR